MSAQEPSSSLFRDLGGVIRSERRRRRWTLDRLAVESGLSSRFLGELERGRANVSLAALAKIAGSYDTTLLDLLQPASADPTVGEAVALFRRLSEPQRELMLAELRQRVREVPEGRRIALVGLRGAGKSSLGREVSRRTSARFVELDEQIEEAAGMPLAELFEIHGEAHYRELERECLDALESETEPILLATGGSLVTHEGTWQALRHRFVVCWLRAEPEDHWNRVRGQGDSRPMAGDPMAMDKLRILLEQRAPLYAKAHHVVDTSACGLEDAIEQVERLAWPVLVGA